MVIPKRNNTLYYFLMEKIIEKILALSEKAALYKEKSDKVSEVCRLIGRAWSGSSFTDHAKYFFHDFKEPKTTERFSIEWGLINGVPDGWVEKNDEAVRVKIENDSGVQLDSMKKLAIELENGFTDIQRESVLLLSEKGFSASDIEKIEKYTIRTTTDIFNSIFPTKYITRDSQAAAGGYYIVPHIYYDAVARFISGLPDELKGFIFELKKLARKKVNTADIPGGDHNKKTFYIENSLILALSGIKSDQYDLSKLVKMCKELNDNYSLDNYLACGMLIRAILDHIPPIFNKKKFSEVANNYGTKSFKDIILPLENTARKISDFYLHNPIRKKELMLNKSQISFQPNMDVLLSEIVRILGKG